MEAAEMHCIKVSHAYEHEDPGKQSLLPPGDGCLTHVLPHHLQVINTRQVTAYLLQEAGGVKYTSAICDALLTPPPGRCIYI